MHLHYNQNAESYTFTMTYKELDALIDVPEMENMEDYEEFTKEVVKLNDFFQFVIQLQTGQKAPEFHKMCLQVGSDFIRYQMHTQMDQNDGRLGRQIGNAFSVEEALVKYSANLFIGEVHKITEELKQKAQTELIEDTYQFLFEDITDIVSFCKAIPSGILDRIKSTLIRTKDGLVLTVVVNATINELKALNLDCIASEWNGVEIERMYEQYEPFDLDNAVLDMRQL